MASEWLSTGLRVLSNPCRLPRPQTSAAQNAALLEASQMKVEALADVAIKVGAGMFELAMPTHGVAAVRIPL